MDLDLHEHSPSVGGADEVLARGLPSNATDEKEIASWFRQHAIGFGHEAGMGPICFSRLYWNGFASGPRFGQAMGCSCREQDKVKRSVVPLGSDCCFICLNTRPSLRWLSVGYRTRCACQLDGTLLLNRSCCHRIVMATTLGGLQPPRHSNVELGPKSLSCRRSDGVTERRGTVLIASQHFSALS